MPGKVAGMVRFSGSAPSPSETLRVHPFRILVLLMSVLAAAIFTLGAGKLIHHGGAPFHGLGRNLPTQQERPA